MFKRSEISIVNALAIPVVMEMVSETMIYAADTAMVGRLGAVALAATGTSGVVLHTIFSVLLAFGIGTQSLVARYVGEENPKRAFSVLSTAGIFSLASGSIIALLSYQIAEFIFLIMSVSPEVTALGIEYTFIRLVATPFLMLSYCVRGYFRGIGDTLTPMILILLTNLLNIFLNYLLIYGKLGFPRYEVKGAAIASSISVVVGSIAFLIVFSVKNWRELSLDSPRKLFVRTEFNRLLRISIPNSIENFMMMFGFSAFTWIVGRLGDVALAAHNVAITIIILSFMPGSGFGIAAATLVGQELGRKSVRNAKSYGYTSTLLGVVLMSIMGIIFLVFPSQLMRLFTSDEAVIRAGINLIIVIAFAQPFDAMNMILASALRGAGDTRWVMMASTVLTWLIFVPVSYLITITFGLGVTGAWTVMALWLFFAAMTFLYRFRSEKWALLKI